jgi:GNAT superfamily N-acetyltransferase
VSEANPFRVLISAAFGSSKGAIAVPRHLWICVAGGAGSREGTGMGANEAAAEVRRAVVTDAVVVAELLDAFNREFSTPTPGVTVLADRLSRLLAGDGLAALLTGEPAAGLAVVSFRPNVWSAGPAALLDELYVQPGRRRQRLGHALLEAACHLAQNRGAETLEINVDGEDTDARRFYEAHGFRHTEPGAAQPMFYYYRNLP